MDINKLKEIRELLIVIDMVNGFINKGALADPSVGKIIPNIEEIVKDFLRRGEGVLFVKDAHNENSIEFKTFPIHCLKGTKEAELVPELKIYENRALSIEKNSTSVMFAPEFLLLLNKMVNLKRIVGVGCESDICVPNSLIPIKNYFNQNNKDIEIVVVENAIETFNSIDHPREEYNRISKMLMRQAGITLVKKYQDIGRRR